MRRALFVALLMRADAAVSESAAIAVHAKHLEASREAGCFQRSIELCAAACAGFLSMLVSAAVNVIQRQKHQFRFTAAGALRTSVGRKRLNLQCHVALRACGLVHGFVSLVLLATARRVFEAGRLSLCSTNAPLFKYLVALLLIPSAGLWPLLCAVARAADMAPPEVRGRKRECVERLCYPAGLANPGLTWIWHLARFL